MDKTHSQPPIDNDWRFTRRAAPTPAEVIDRFVELMTRPKLRTAFSPRIFCSPVPALIVSIYAFSAPSILAITIPTVSVGDVGNPNDPTTSNLYGGVGYAYNIGKYEVTVGQYTAFLNAVAATDTYSLYNTSMATNLNIAESRVAGRRGIMHIA
jgi:hypothetical protein